MRFKIAMTALVTGLVCIFVAMLLNAARHAPEWAYEIVAVVLIASFATEIVTALLAIWSGKD